MPTLYNLRLLAPNHYAMAKFDDDFNVAAIYNLHSKGFGFTCDCPASARAVKTKPCKHQRMMAVMMGACNTDRFYDPETHLWHQPMTADLHAITRESEAAECKEDTSSLTHLTEDQANQLLAKAEDPKELIYGFNNPELPVGSATSQAVDAREAGPHRQPPAQTPVVTRRI